MYELQDNTIGIGLTNGSVYQTVKRYYCAWNDLDNKSHLLLYGSKAWKFPVQDVKLELSYPVYQKNYTTDVLVAMFDVILRIDSTQSRGYITSGGILQIVDYIKLLRAQSSWKGYVSTYPLDRHHLSTLSSRVKLRR
ncbi:unnamed protein product, partial [Iphiclides podalirius]